MFCGKCGAQNPDSSQFCSSYGSPELYCWLEGGAFDDSYGGDLSIGTWKVVDGDSVSVHYNSMKTFFSADEGSESVKVSLSEDGQELTF